MTDEPQDDCDENECTCIPEDAVVIAECRIVEYFNPADGETWKADLSHDGSGGPLDPDKLNALTLWAQQVYAVPMLANLMHAMYCTDEEEE